MCASVPQHGEPLSPAASTLAMVLTRGLSMEQQKSSRDSLQYSSGYSTQTNTPSCSEDTIPSQGNTRPLTLTCHSTRHIFTFLHLVVPFLGALSHVGSSVNTRSDLSSTCSLDYDFWLCALFTGYLQIHEWKKTALWDM